MAMTLTPNAPSLDTGSRSVDDQHGHPSSPSEGGASSTASSGIGLALRKRLLLRLRNSRSKSPTPPTTTSVDDRTTAASSPTNGRKGIVHKTQFRFRRTRRESFESFSTSPTQLTNARSEEPLQPLDETVKNLKLTKSDGHPQDGTSVFSPPRPPKSLFHRTRILTSTTECAPDTTDAAAAATNSTSSAVTASTTGSSQGSDGSLRSPSPHPPTEVQSEQSQSGAVWGQQQQEEEEAIVPWNPCGPTSILRHSFVEEWCSYSGYPDGEHKEAEEEAGVEVASRRIMLGDDPTVQESIECVFSYQLEEGLGTFFGDEDEDEDEDDGDGEEANQVDHGESGSPRSSRSGGVPRSWSHLASRTVSSLSSRMSSPKRRSRRRYEKESLEHVGTCGTEEEEEASTSLRSLPSSSTRRSTSADAQVSPIVTALEPKPEPMPDASAPIGRCCQACRENCTAPALPPARWPQRPLLMRPTPGYGTRVRGVRFGGSEDYLWSADSGSQIPWFERLNELWRGEEAREVQEACCPSCALVPVNNGNEAPGDSLVVDFESDLFIGTIQMRIRHASGTTPDPYDDSRGYFAGLHRRYQAVVRGMFKRDGIPMTEFVTGQAMDRPCGRLPPKWMLRGAVKVVSFFAPQMQAKFDGRFPVILSPLGSTPQAIRADPGSPATDPTQYSADVTLEKPQEEPKEDETSLLPLLPPHRSASKHPSSLGRARVRKKAFDKLYASRAKSPAFRTDTIYTFEFLQHLINFNDFHVELGAVLGKLQLMNMLDGQPLRFMAAHQVKATPLGSKPELDCLWSFDLWHEGLMDAARRHDSHKDD